MMRTDVGQAVWCWPDAGMGVRPYVSPRQRQLTARETETRDVAYALKATDPVAIAMAAVEMAEWVPAGALLVPIPNSDGDVMPNLILARAIAEIAAARVQIAIRRAASVPSVRVLRRHGKLVTDPVAHHQFDTVPGALAGVGGAPIYFVDNVMTTGGTFQAARVALGFRGRGLAWAVAGPMMPAGSGVIMGGS